MAMQRWLLQYGSVLGLLMLVWCADTLAQSTPQIIIEKAGSTLLPLAIPQMLGELGDPTLGQHIRSVLRQDLELTGLFRIVDQATYPEVPQSVEQIDYASWASLGVVGVITGQMSNAAGSGQLFL
ncbi:MAG: hypothetical protein ONB06_10685, partial [candidate division KSB1 bacterium]|nr:hypothetical protein [candidate division KSB1 bacterium]